jgi:peptidoglycan lytic transglycosylase
MTMRADFRRASPLPTLLAIAFLLAACGGPAGGPGGGLANTHPVFKVGAPYEVKGVWYTPRADYSYDKTGTASWYGAQFQGRYTANGEIFDLNGLTAAHKTLPLPSIVEVTNLRNGRSIRLRVNDRGPFADGRILDVSRRAAQLLGFETAGTTPVRVRILRRQSIAAAEQVIRESGQSPAVLAEAIAAAGEPVKEAPSEPTQFARTRSTPPLYPEPSSEAPPPALPPPMRVASLGPPPPLPPPYSRPSPEAPSRPPAPRRLPNGSPFAMTPRQLFVQAGATTREDAAQRLSSAVASLGEVAILTSSEGGYTVYRVCLGPVASGQQAEMLRSRLLGSGYTGARIVEN